MLYSALRAAAASIRNRSHERRADLFIELMRPRPGQTLLDLGGGDGSLAARIASRVDVRVTVADMEDTRLLARERYGFAEVQLLETGPLPLDDRSFDLVLCNSVIEHVTLPRAECARPGVAEREWRERSAAARKTFADEIRRVGRGWFVQTPHRAFPIDAHTWLPLTNFLSHEAARKLVRVTDRVWVKKCGVADWHLLGTDDVRRLFPESALYIERIAGIPKSLIAFRPRAPV